MTVPFGCEVRPLLAGSAEGEALVLREALSLWGGLEPRTGRVTDRRHPVAGTVVTGRVLVMPSGRGSSSSSSVLAEAIRLRTAPAAILLEQADEILVLGAMVAEHLYGRTCPVAELPAGHGIETGMWVRVRPPARVTVDHDPHPRRSAPPRRSRR